MNTARQPLVSIVTPMYNEAEHLAECIESVLAQTYRSWDYTIVNNCSTDGSAEIAYRYAAKDPRIKIVDNHNVLRALANHNVALQHISPLSKYCKVVFADDWIFPDCLERMVAVAEEHPTVGVVGAYSLEGRQVMCTGLQYPSRLVSGREICRKHLLERLYVWGSANTILYRADLVRKQTPFYNEANIHADTEACFALLKDSDFGFVHQVLTFSRERLDSLTAMSSDIQSSFAGMLYVLVKHGPAFLANEELQLCINRHLSQYYQFLGKSTLLKRDKLFWDYHKKQLIEAGVGFSKARLARAVLTVLYNASLNPKDTIEKLLKRRRTSNASVWLLKQGNSEEIA